MALATTAFTLGVIGLARADAIDGGWCSADGRRFGIEGSSMTTTNGTRLSRTYTRHSFAFTLPPGESDGGSLFDMVLQGETQVGGDGRNGQFPDLAALPAGHQLNGSTRASAVDRS